MTEFVTDRKRQLLLFAIMAMAFFLDGLDGTIVSIALPTIGDSFSMSTGGSSWIITIYFMVMAGLILVFGRLADNGHLKKILGAGFMVFSLASLACALSWDITSLLTFRAVQGVGSAMLAATGIMLVVKFLPLNMRYFGMSLTVVGFSLGSALGPALGGVLTQSLSWHWIFLINVPVGIACTVLTVFAVPTDKADMHKPLDFPGSILLFAAITAGLYAVESVPTNGLDVISTAALVACIVILALFIVWERRTADPVLHLPLFKLPKFDLAVVIFLLVNASFMGIMYLSPFLMKIEMGYDTILSGAVLLVQAVVTLIICMPVGRMVDKKGTRPFAVAGCLVLTATFALLFFAGKGTGMPLLLAAMVLMGVMWGIGGSALGPRIVEFAPADRSADASTLLSFFIYLGSALGTALFSGLFNIGSGSSGIAITDLPASIFMDGWVFSMAAGLVIAAACTAGSYILRPADD